MAKKNTKNNTISDAEKIGIGVALTTTAIAAAGAYFLYGSANAAKNRKKVKGWALKVKGEVLEMLEKAGDLTAEQYQEAVEKAIAGYSKMQHISAQEVEALRKEMMAYWRQLSKDTTKAKKAAKKSVKKAVKKATSKAKSTAKKAAR